MLFCLLPVFLFTKSIKNTSLVGFSIILFLNVYKDFFIGNTSAYHDTFWGAEMLFRIVKQWVHNGYYPGWNPYLNGGEPIYLFSNNFIKIPYILFSFLGEWIRLPTHTLFNHCFIFIYLNFCIGSLLLFFVLFDDFKIVFFCFLSLLFSGCFDVNLGQPSGIIILYFLPYVLFGLVTSLKNKTPYGIIFAILYLSLSLNQYIPIYLFSVVFLFMIMLFLFYPQYIKVIFKIIKQHYKIIALVVVFAILAAGPAIFLHSKLKDFVSPVRDISRTGGSLTLEKSGAQPRVNASFSGYRILVDRIIVDKRGGIHHAFYFGIIPLILIPIALFTSRNKTAWVFFITAIFIVLIGTGNHFILSFLYKFVPGFNMVRHTFPFAQFVPFLLICVSGFGLKAILSSEKKDNFKIMLFSIVTAELLFLVSDSKLSMLLILGSLFAIFFSIILSETLKNRAKPIQLAYLPIFLILILDLYIFNLNFLTYTDNFNYYYLAPPAKISDPPPVKYPLERKFYSEILPPIPPDLSPILFKEATLTSAWENFILFRYARLNDMLSLLSNKSELGAFGVGRPIIYFTNKAKVLGSVIRKDDIIREILQNFKEKEASETTKVFFQRDEIDFNLSNKSGEYFYLKNFKMLEIDNPNRIDMEIDVPVDGYLVRLENFHKGWKSTVDGIPAKIYRANYAFQAIRIPAGKHRVVFEFKTIYPFLLSVFIAISILTWIFLNYYLYTYNLNPKPRDN